VKARLFFATALSALLCSSCVNPQGAPSTPPDPQAVTRGAYIAAAGDCLGCHTDKKNNGPPLAGGHPLGTDFGVFFAPNITFDKQAGIGTWSEDDFHRAMRKGKGAHGEFLYPVFPYPSFSGMSDQDISDLYAYLRAQPTSSHSAKSNAVKFPFNMRPLLGFWRLLFFREGPLQPVAGQTAEWNRGRYLAETVAHCSDCHTPRNVLGAQEKSRAYAGDPHGPDNQKIPNITAASRVGKWSVDDVVELLDSGMTPDGDFMGGTMATVVKGTSKLTPADRKAIAVYVKSLPPKASASGASHSG
jgi:mono/diheme cytochrome c family protein